MTTDYILRRFKDHRQAIQAEAKVEIEELTARIRANAKLGRHADNFKAVERLNLVRRTMPQVSAEFEVETFGLLLDADDFHHVSCGEDNAGEWFQVYRVEPASPSRCMHAMTFPRSGLFAALMELRGRPALAACA